MAEEAVRRTFEVALPLAETWGRLAQVERWPEWAPHIRSLTVEPPGPLGPSSSGTLVVKTFGRNTFTVTAWEPGRRWNWTSRLPGVRVDYDHRFESFEGGTRCDWIVTLAGPLAFLVRPVFAAIYGRNVDRAIPGFQAWAVANPADGTPV